MHRKGGSKGQSKKKKGGSSKWTPEIGIDSFVGQDDAFTQLGRKLGYEEGGAIPDEFKEDGLDFLLSLPKYKEGAENVDFHPVYDKEQQPPRILTVKEKQKKPKASDDDHKSEKERIVQKKTSKTKGNVEKKVEKEAKQLHVVPKRRKGEDGGAVVEKKTKNAIDDIFDARKKGKGTDEKAKKKIDEEEGEEDADAAKVFAKLKRLKEKKQPKKGEQVDFFASRSLGSGRKRTEEGYPIYTEDELKLGQGGDTPDCPFDCNCCF